MRQGKIFALMLVGMASGLSASGCWTGGVNQVPMKGSLSADLTSEATPRLARLQQAEPANPKLLPQAAPPLPSSPIQPTKLSAAKNSRVSVRAWVNGKPIFDEEVLQKIPRSAWNSLQPLPEVQRNERLADAYNKALDGLIEQEVAYQDAVKKLEKGNPRALDKLKKIAVEEYEKQMANIRKQGVSEEQIKEVEHLLRRQAERDLIATEYVRSKIFPIIQINHEQIQEYYDAHKNEFQQLDTVQWQDIFIAVGPKLPTVAHVRRFAEDLIAQCRTVADFEKLIQFDDGDSKFRNGEGLGTRRGEIRPAEVENILFRLREGEIGPVVELSTGVHIVRVVKREYAGQIPLDSKTQTQIRNKMRNQLAEREYQRIVREMRSRATIEIEREGQ